MATIEKKEVKYKNPQKTAKDLETKIKKLQEKKRRALAQAGEKARKERTHRFCVLGGNIEKLLKRPLTDDDVQKTIDFLETQERNGKFYSKALSKRESRKEKIEQAGE